MRAYQNGRHEHGQNFLVDRGVIATIVDIVATTRGPIVEIGAGDGALTIPLQRLDRRVTAVEIDPGLAAALARRVGGTVDVVVGDFLRYRCGGAPGVLVGNLPFHLTTSMLRHVLRVPGWTDAVLLVQWEVARRRAGIGGATMMTAQWAPWFTFDVRGRVPASAFRPRPAVDGGLLVMRRRADPLLPHGRRAAFQRLVHRVYTGRGRGLPDVLRRAGAFDGAAARRWVRGQRLGADALPKDLSAEQWVDLFRCTGASPPGPRP